MPQIALNERNYVRWQNRATRFYLGARLLYLKEQYAPAAFCANQALELLLKGTLVYWDKSFNPEAVRHSFAKLQRILRNKVPCGKSVQIPAYFSEARKYQTVTRYPNQKSDLVGIPASFLPDLDDLFYRLVTLVPFQFNTGLKGALSGRRKADLLALRRNNCRMRDFRRHLGVKVRK